MEQDVQVAALERILGKATSELERRLESFSKAKPREVEQLVYEAIRLAAKSYGVVNSVEWVGGQRFPDITIGKKFGVEVKSSHRHDWKTVGSSIAEGTRVEGVEVVYLFYVKLDPPIEFRYRLYQECLSEAVVTHSPRYQIDMSLPLGKSLFDKLGISYEALRTQENPIQTVVDFYRRNMRPGESTWWANGNFERASRIVVRLWNTLRNGEKAEIRLKSLCLFPEILGNHISKYHRVNLWLATHEGIVVPNIRDLFSAGGRGQISYRDKVYEVPHIIELVALQAEGIRATLQSLLLDELEEFSNDYTTSCNRWFVWVHLASRHYAEHKREAFPLREFLLDDAK